MTITRPDIGARISYQEPLGANDWLAIGFNRCAVRLGTAGRRHRVSVNDWDAFTIPPRSTVGYVLGHGRDTNTTAGLVALMALCLVVDDEA